MRNDLRFLNAPTPSGTNYLKVKQNSEEWQQARKNRITGSRLPSLLGMYGKKKFDEMWRVFIEGTSEKCLSGIENIKRGHLFKKDGIKRFKKVSKTTTNTCGFFFHPCNQHYGASPDALGPNGVLVEIKTRAPGTDAPTKSLSTYPNYFIQC